MQPQFVTARTTHQENLYASRLLVLHEVRSSDKLLQKCRQIRLITAAFDSSLDLPYRILSSQLVGKNALKKFYKDPKYAVLHKCFTIKKKLPTQSQPCHTNISSTNYLSSINRWQAHLFFLIFKNITTLYRQIFIAWWQIKYWYWWYWFQNK